MRDFLQHWCYEGDEPIAHCGSQADTSAERRGDPRVAVAAQVRLEADHTPAGARTMLSARLRDASPHGVGLVSDEPILSGSRWRARIYDGARELGQLCLTARHCRTANEGGYSVGFQLSAPPFLMDVLTARSTALDAVAI